jgi:amino acid transporter
MNGKPVAANGGDEHISAFTRIRRTLLGGRRNPFDPKVFQHISLIAFFAWVGMGADGISSACYGPEEAYKAITGYTFLAPILALAIIAVVNIISASYAHIIEQFPSGGGGYVVASKLLSPNAGLLSGSALIVDYFHTISVSIVAGVDAVFSLLPPEYAQHKVAVSIIVVAMMTVMNLRGLRESVLILTPIFLTFIISNVGLVTYGLCSHLPVVSQRFGEAAVSAQQGLGTVGLLAIMGVFLHAFSMGAGTFTGIEAVSNGVLSLREPRVRTGKRTTTYMAISLSFLAAALLLNYYVFDVHPVAGKTLNAVLFSDMLSQWSYGSFHVGGIVLWIALVSASFLLIVAAQTGFIDGPRVLANMALDSGLPHRLSHLSERLVAQNGILMMGGTAILTIILANGDIVTLVDLYAINVFITFSLSQLGMLRLWIRRRRDYSKWLGNLLINGLGFVVCASLLVLMITQKFRGGGWVTMVMTGGIILLCVGIRHHYKSVQNKVEKIDEILGSVPFGESPIKDEPIDPNEPKAVVLVERYSGTGIHVILDVQRLFGSRFKQFIFVSVGAIDSGHFKGSDDLASLDKEVRNDAEKYVLLARSYGLKATARTGLAIDCLAEIERLCLEINREFPNSVFFAARLLFWRDTLLTHLLHNETAVSLQRRLLFHGLQFVVLPVRLQ